MGKSELKKRKEGEEVESLPKLSVVLKGSKGSDTITQILPDLHHFRLGSSLLLGKKHSDAYPFDQAEAFQNFLRGKEASLFVLGSHSKKRPNNLVMGRTFNEELMDMYEFEVKNYQSTTQFKSQTPAGVRPLLIFQGDAFEVDETYRKMKNFFLDYFGGKFNPSIDMKSLNTVIVLTATDDSEIHFHHYVIDGADSNEIGPAFNMKLRRYKLYDEKTHKDAFKLVKKHKKVKNVTTNALKQKRGQVHVQQQPIKTIQIKKRKPRKLKG